jgi:hypothetical protein
VRFLVMYAVCPLECGNPPWTTVPGPPALHPQRPPQADPPLPRFLYSTPTTAPMSPPPPSLGATMAIMDVRGPLLLLVPAQGH